MKVFLSSPMQGKSEEEQKSCREWMQEAIDARFGCGIEYLYGNGEKRYRNALHGLSRSIELLSMCDVAAFHPEWRKHRGCRIERQCALRYGLFVIDIDSE